MATYMGVRKAVGTDSGAREMTPRDRLITEEFKNNYPVSGEFSKKYEYILGFLRHHGESNILSTHQESIFEVAGYGRTRWWQVPKKEHVSFLLYECGRQVVNLAAELDFRHAHYIGLTRLICYAHTTRGTATIKCVHRVKGRQYGQDLKIQYTEPESMYAAASNHAAEARRQDALHPPAQFKNVTTQRGAPVICDFSSDDDEEEFEGSVHSSMFSSSDEEQDPEPPKRDLEKEVDLLKSQLAHLIEHQISAQQKQIETLTNALHSVLGTDPLISEDV